MKKNLSVCVFIFLFSLSLSLPKLNAESKLTFSEPSPGISMDFQDANLKDILKVFSIQSGLNFIASEGVQDRKITLYLDKVPLKNAMDKLFKANNLSYELDQDANIFIVKDLGKPGAETETRVFYLKYATVSSSALQSEKSNQMASSDTGTSTTSSGGTTSSSSTSSSGASSSSSSSQESGITNAVKKLLSAEGSVIEDSRTNSLIVTDTPNRMPVIAKVIASLDLPVPQVMLEVEMLDVSKNVVDTIGIKFGQTPLTAVITGTSQSIGFPFESWGKIFVSEANRGTLGINSGTSTYQAQLDFLRTNTDTKFLARPKLLTLNNETAEIRIATNESIGVTTTTASAGGSSGTTTQEPERSETGVILRVTPQINTETGEITMFIYPKVAEAVAGNTLTSGSATFRFRDPEERSTKSIVRVKDGETVVIGGLLRNEFTQDITKLPILGDIPLLGNLFRHKNKSKDKQRELLVFITPRIIPDTNIKLAQSKNVMLPEIKKEKSLLLPQREQNTASGASRELEISSTLKSFENRYGTK